ncbi:hypothetical protein NDI43_08035 [Microcoleus vaginatus GB2-A3]|uniref:hypothetical protein n=1 Tax=Microcoleus vaginatus TaxID=119532 RepID=UPI0032A90D02
MPVCTSCKCWEVNIGRKKEEGRGKKEEGRRKREEGRGNILGILRYPASGRSRVSKRISNLKS